jgi:hypothetical protein
MEQFRVFKWAYFQSVLVLPFSPQLLSSRLLSINIKIITYKTIILPVVLYGCETWSLTLRESAQENIWTKEVWNDRRLEKTA